MLSCIILNYNDWVRTRQLVEKIHSYSSIDLIVVVDNCSTDDSVSHLKQLKYSNYKFVETNHNGGYGYGNNIGIKTALKLGSDYFLIANPDVNFSDECVEHMKITLSQLHDVGAIGAKETYLGTYAWKYTSDLDDVLSASLFFNRLLKRRYYKKDYFVDKDWTYVDVIPGCFLLIEKAVLDSEMLYDEDFFLYEEEKVVYKKVLDKGLKSAIDLCVSFEHLHFQPQSISIKSLLIGKKRLLDSKLLFLKKYRSFSNYQLLISELFFTFCFLEMLLYGLLLKVKSYVY